MKTLQQLRFTEKNRHLVAASILLVIIAAIAFSGKNLQYIEGNVKEENGQVVIFTEGATHSCEIEPFSKRMRRGQKTLFVVNLFPSRADAPYRLALGELPRGVTGAFDEQMGDNAPGRVRLVIKAQKQASQGSYSIPVLYQEKFANTQLATNFCQFNFVVD